MPLYGASSRFRFRFVTRGRQTNALVGPAVRSLLHCHPGADVVVVDANDEPTAAAEHFGPGNNVTVVHLRPGDDPVARAAGRGTAGHLFYWRHSPEVLGRLPPWSGYDVHADADLLFLRPLCLGALEGPLARGRIAAAVDEETMNYYTELGQVASKPVSGLFGTPGAGGPLVQAGLVFSNPADDGGLYGLLWRLAVEAAETGSLNTVPSDDMGVLSALLGPCGPLWERYLPLGHECNYISGALKDPGVFGCVAHFGGRRAKKFLLAQSETLFPPGLDSRRTPWGSMRLPADEGRITVVRGLWRQSWLPAGKNAHVAEDTAIEVALPFSLTWQAPPDHSTALIDGIMRTPSREGPIVNGVGPVLFVYLDGHLVDRLPIAERRFQRSVRLREAETLTLVCIGPSPGRIVRLRSPFAAP
ncbi:hypothetical protein [Streptomyces sp. NPDC018059]|uniref:hypothetical protein n=1 Tax=Streptomyces sp. NPDC018059 TaxID=3365041 RepID=UPI003796F672